MCVCACVTVCLCVNVRMLDINYFIVVLSFKKLMAKKDYELQIIMV